MEENQTSDLKLEFGGSVSNLLGEGSSTDVTRNGLLVPGQLT